MKQCGLLEAADKVYMIIAHLIKARGYEDLAEQRLVFSLISCKCGDIKQTI